jgi:hypothetical protein
VGINIIPGIIAGILPNIFLEIGHIIPNEREEVSV